MGLMIIILLYSINVFINRWLNKILYKRNYEKKLPATWFLSIIGTFLFIWIYLEKNDKDTWFNGKNW